MYELSGFDGKEEALEHPFCSSEELEQRLKSADLWTPLIVSALEQALSSHRNKTRDSGRPYLDEHIFPVAMEVLEYLRQRGKSTAIQEPVVAASLLHDTVEDDENFDLEQCEDTFGLAVSTLVYPLTKIGVEHDIYIAKIANAPKYAKVIKLIDRVNNLQCSVLLANTMPHKLSKYTQETEESYLPIADLLLDKELYERIHSLVNLAHTALQNLGVENAREI
jgi:(p)ppGpp synthase/HD superfamily hydrolase